MIQKKKKNGRELYKNKALTLSRNLDKKEKERERVTLGRTGLRQGFILNF